VIISTLSLPLGVHLFCLPKINEPNKRAAHARPAGTLRFSIWSGMTEKSLRSNSRHADPTSSAMLGFA
tara:strand:+ start:2436 stop:2639 length:204 start_codon:yes stop_codon:yes gene_type:complete